MDFTYLKPAKVWPEIEHHPDAPSYRTVERWCEGKARPPLWAIEILRAKLLGRTEEAAPPWWGEAAKNLLSEIVENRTMFQKWVETQAQKDRTAMIEALRKMTDDALADIAKSQQSRPSGDRKPSVDTQGGGARDPRSRPQPKRKEK